MLRNYLMLLSTIVLSISGQTLLKIGMKNIGKIDNVSLANIAALAWQMGTNVYVFSGLALFVIGTFIWLVLLSRLDLSFVYPFGALQYVFIFLISYFLLGEQIKAGRIVGVGIILVGIYVITRFG